MKDPNANLVTRRPFTPKPRQGFVHKYFIESFHKSNHEINVELRQENSKQRLLERLTSGKSINLNKLFYATLGIIAFVITVLILNNIFDILQNPLTHFHQLPLSI